MVRLSVIIPVYRVRHTLDRCVRSVLSQSLTDYEVILVDDGSPDSCGRICDRYASEYGNIKVIHKENGGLSDARNSGLAVADGEYVTFVDSDDFIGDGTYRRLMRILDGHREYDMLEFPIFVHYGSSEERVFNPGCKVYRSPLDYFLSGMAYNHSYACNKIFRRRLFDGVEFPRGKVFEDMHVLPLLLMNTKIIATADVGMYYYCWNARGITATADGGALASLLSAHVSVIRRLGGILISSNCFVKYYMHVLNIQCDVCRLAKIGITLPYVDFPYFKSFCYLLKSSGVKLALKYVIYHVCGIKSICLLNKFQYGLKEKIIKVVRGR